uniref:Capsid protein n=1 Tax=Cressdnaviricota sp. TaxID=2748378 RepID=A0A8E7YWF3_9VIRU|nr:capsid protein [Cressdnaviricota sp.]
MPRIRVESKYIQDDFQNLIAYNPTQSSSLNYLNTFSYLQQYLFYSHRIVGPTPGYNENERVGDRINTSSIVLQYELKHDNSTYLYTTGTPYSYSIPNIIYRMPQPPPLLGFINPTEYDPNYYTLHLESYKVPMRVMVVEFDKDVFDDVTDISGSNSKIASWFFTTYKDTALQYKSTYQTLFEPNNPYAGKFKILYDKVTNFTFKKSSEMYTVTIPYKREWKFPRTSTTANDPLDKVTFIITIGCLNPEDISDTAVSTYLNGNITSSYTGNYFRLGRITGNYKLNYTDM